MMAKNLQGFHYGVAVTDLDGDGAFEFVVACSRGSNRVMRWDGLRLVDSAGGLLADTQRQAIGLCGADVDGDGREELYVLNTDTFAGQKHHADRLLDADATGRLVDLFELGHNEDALNLTSGRSVGCVDRLGTGRYAFVVTNYGGAMRCYEVGSDAGIVDMAIEAGLAYAAGGRSLLCAPLVSDHEMDIFLGAELGPNRLFRAAGNGTYEDVGAALGVADPDGNARGVAALDADSDGALDLVWANWEGPARMMLQVPGQSFLDVTPATMAEPSLVRTVIAADFDNDGYEEIFFNSMGEPNRLFAVRERRWQRVDPGSADEPHGLGTGAAVADIDGDGVLELLVAHGESAPQPLSLHKAARAAEGNHWIRVAPKTRFGAPARGAVVRVESGGRVQLRVIDAGSGYLCQMEPVAHVGLNRIDRVERVTVTWPDGATTTMERPAADTTHVVRHP